MKTWIIIVIVLAGAVAVASYHYRVPEMVAIGTGGGAKLLCSAVFVGGRDEALVRKQEFERLSSPGKYLGLLRLQVDYRTKTTSASLFGMQRRKAVFREGIGCTATEGISEAELRAQGDGGGIALKPLDPKSLWPQGAATLAQNPPANVDRERLNTALNRAFSESDPNRPRATRAALVVYGGHIIAERYADGFGPDTAHMSQSVAKTFTGALTGILVGQGRLDVNQRAPIAEWSDPADPRSAITLDHLLRMQSGLEFEENYVKIGADISSMYIGGNVAKFAAAKPLEAPPGTQWKYSTGTSNILGRIVSEAAGESFEQRLSFPRRALFEPLGMRHSVIEVDGFGSFIGGSMVFASARDYARLALLYLRDGVWDGKQILPKGWVDYTITPTPNVPPGYSYGVQVWLNDNQKMSERRWPELPADTFAMLGIQQQNVVAIPSLDLVVVRLGLSEFDNWDLQSFVTDIIAAISTTGTHLKGDT